MGNRLASILFIIFFCVSILGAQDWQSPIDFPIRLSGTFCELRSNHFHHGIDIKSSRGVSGDKIYAIGDGKVQRLRVQAAGYGLSVYILHPEGYVSVYGHLQKFSPKLDSVVTHFQYELEQSEIDIYCDSLNILIAKGEQIANMGSTGYSFGPHLHFEIRDAKTEITINPFHFGFEISDKIKPKLSQIRLDYLKEDGRKYGETTAQVYIGKSRNYIKGDTIKVGAWRCGLALRTYDLMDKTPNRNGVYRIRVDVDSQEVYRFVGDSVHFSESKAVNIIKDVVSYAEKRERWYLAYNLPGGPLKSYIMLDEDNGWIKPFEKKPQRVDVFIEDFSGNINHTQFIILRNQKMAEPKSRSYNYMLPYGEPNIIRLNGSELRCPEGTFYQDQFLTLEEIDEKTDGVISRTVHMDGNGIPFHRPCTLRLDVTQQDSSKQSKARMIRCNHNSSYHIGGEWVDGSFECPITSFGEYKVMEDNDAPTFVVKRCPSTMANGQQISFTIKDEYESKGYGAEVHCRAEIDGKWIPMRHDAKSNTFAYTLRDLTAGEHTIDITYADAVNNTGHWSKIVKILK